MYIQRTQTTNEINISLRCHDNLFVTGLFQDLFEGKYDKIKKTNPN